VACLPPPNILMINGESILFGGMAIATMWKLSTITSAVSRIV
jgi:hypothetical protein